MQQRPQHFTSVPLENLPGALQKKPTRILTKTLLNRKNPYQRTKGASVNSHPSVIRGTMTNKNHTMKLFGKSIKPPSVLTSDRYALAQVTLYIFALVLGVSAVFQMSAAFAASDAQIPAGGSRLLLYATPAAQNAFWCTGMVYLSHKLPDDESGIVWKLCVGIMLMQIMVTVLQLSAQPNMLPLMALALAIFGLGSLLVGKDFNPRNMQEE